MDYAKLDIETKYKYRSEKLKYAKEAGYTYISEAICELIKTHSLQTTGEIMGVNISSIAALLKKWGVKNPRGRGGNHFGRVYYGYHKGRENPNT